MSRATTVRGQAALFEVAPVPPAGQLAMPASGAMQRGAPGPAQGATVGHSKRLPGPGGAMWGRVAKRSRLTPMTGRLRRPGALLSGSVRGVRAGSRWARQGAGGVGGSGRGMTNRMQTEASYQANCFARKGVKPEKP